MIEESKYINFLPVRIAPGAKEKIMKKTNKLVALLLALLLLFGAMAGTLSSCGDPEEDDPCTEHVDSDKDGKCDKCDEKVEPASKEKTTYTISVKTAGGMPLEGVTTVIYADETLDVMNGYASTGADGIATLSLYPSNSYAIELNGVPDGYNTAAYYTFTGTSAVITLTSALQPDKGLSGVKYAAGDIMHDFTVTTTDNKKVTLSELFASGKKLVMLNFWYVDCSACQMEFPALEEAYEKYSDKVSVIALNPDSRDTDTDIALFKGQNQLTFDVAKDIGLANAFGVTNFPTSVFIDRYGAITFIEVGALTETKYFDKLFKHYTSEPYIQKLIVNYEDIAPVEKPDIEMPSSDEISSVISSGSDKITYYPEKGTADAEYAWPFVITEKDGVPCIVTTNAEKDSSYAMMHADVTLTEGQVLEVEYFLSTEQGADLLYILVDGVSIYTLSGEGKGWQKCYPYVATEDGTYKVSFLYLKDSTTDAEDDCVYIKSIAIGADTGVIDTETYIPRWAATEPNESGIGYDKYITPVFNESDGYYHVNSANGPLLLANMMGVTQFSSEDSVYSIVYLNAYNNGNLAKYYDAIIKYCNYASNAEINGLCTVDKDLMLMLQAVATEAGYEKDNANAWLQFCLYYNAYGTGGKELHDPIAGLSAHSAYKAEEGTVNGNEFPNTYVYNRPIMPKGLWFEFTPTRTGAYKIASNAPSTNNIAETLLGWIFRADGSLYYEYAAAERIFTDSTNVFMYAYLEAGKSYYIDIAYYDIYTYKSFGFGIEYLGESYELFRAVSPGAPFTYEVGKGYELYEMNGTLVEGGNDFFASITTDGNKPTEAFYDDIVYYLIRGEGSTEAVEKYVGKDKSGNAYLKITIDTANQTIRFECSNPGLTSESLKDVTVKYKLVDADVTDKIIAGGTKVVYDADADRYYNVLPNGDKGNSKIYADFTFTTGIFNNKSLISMINPAVIFKNDKGELDRVAGMLSLNLYKELVGANETYSYVKSATFNGENYSGFTKVVGSGAENELAGQYIGYLYEMKQVGEESVKTAVAKLVVIIDAAGNAVLKQYADPAADIATAAATVTKTVTYQLISFAFNFAVTENDHNALLYLINCPTDDALREYWGENYEENCRIYQISDLKQLKFHGNGVDKTSEIVKYAQMIITDSYNPMSGEYADDPATDEIEKYPMEIRGCVEVDEDLAALLQMLIDKYSFEGVENSWVKLCYYYETIGEGWQYISPLH